MALGQSTLSDDERRTEGEKLLKELADFTEAMEPHERAFVTSLLQRCELVNLYVSPKQLFWLRDLFNKYCV